MRYTFNFNSFLKQSNDDGSGIGVVRGTGRQCQHLISSSIFFVGCEYILIYVLCIFFYMSRQQSQTVRRRFPAVQPLDSSVPGQPGVRVLAGLWYCPPLPSHHWCKQRNRQPSRPRFQVYVCFFVFFKAALHCCFGGRNWCCILSLLIICVSRRYERSKQLRGEQNGNR